MMTTRQVFIVAAQLLAIIVTVGVGVVLAFAIFWFCAWLAVSA